MKKRGKYTKKPSTGRIILWCAAILALVAAVVLGVMYFLPKFTGDSTETTGTAAPTTTAATTTAPAPTETEPLETTEPAPKWEVGYIGGLEAEVPYYDLQGNLVGTLTRGTYVEYGPNSDGRICFVLDCMAAYLAPDTYLAAEDTAVIPEHTLYVRTAVNLRDAGGRLLEAFAQ